MSQTKQITGIILCGGKSSRMGENKALLKINGKCIISYVVDILQPFCKEIIISTNTNELDFLPYSKVNDIYNNIGPISGIFSSLLKSTTNKNIVLSCDTPFINSIFLNKLLSYSHNYDIVLPKFNNHLQTMTGFFSKNIIPIVNEEIKKENYIPPKIFEKCKLKKLEIDKKSLYYNKNLFFNINSPNDYKKAQEIIKTMPFL